MSRIDHVPEGEKYYAALKELHECFDAHLSSLIVKLVLTPRQKALKLLLLLARCLTGPMVGEARARGFQGHLVLARAAWEHYVDFETILRSQGDVHGARFLAFSEIQRWNRNERIKETRSRLGKEYQDPTAAYDRESLDDLIKRHWPGYGLATVHKIRHWDLRTLKARTKRLGAKFELEYVESYSMLSWASHASAAGVVNLDEETFVQLSAYAFHVFFDSLTNMTWKFFEDAQVLGEVQTRLETVLRTTLDSPSRA